MSNPRPAGDYGVDAPYVPILSAAAGLVFLALGVLAQSPLPLITGIVLLAQAGIYLHTTRRGKFVVWARILESLAATPPAASLDVGCGRGMVAIMTASRFPAAEATGLDLWRTQDQSGNSDAAARANAQAQGVAEHVAFVTGDMTALPLADRSFDLITANAAVHNVSDRDLRRTVIKELLRVARPGAQIAIVDMRHTGQYADDLRAFGATDVQHRSLGPIAWYGGPWTASRLVTARAPAAQTQP